MLVSWKWLQTYVTLNMSVEELTDRLTMSGLNLEEFQAVGDDWCIDLEVTSNRPDCLGHLGIAREVAALYGSEVCLPHPQPATVAERTDAAVSVTIEAADVCPKYIARVIRGVTIGPSPTWLQERLKTVGIACINNVVDVTNYVMLECSQPLHAFDFARVQGAAINVRRAKPGETLKAINQKDYVLSSEMCVIADAHRPIALAGVMGGLDTEITDQTTSVLVEAASFAPLAIRSAARKLSLQSPSSYRFERALDQTGPEYASARCCELILQLAGGELLAEPVVASTAPPPASTPIPLRYARIRKILGYDIPRERALQILAALGLPAAPGATDEQGAFLPPSHRRDLTREIDLIEEVARIYGYNHMPEDAQVPLCANQKSLRERVLERVRAVLLANGFFEAMTLSFISESLQAAFCPYPEQPPLCVEHSLRKGESLLRQSLVPSLLACRRENERHGAFGAKLFEIAKVFLGGDSRAAENAVEPMMVSGVSSMSFAEMRGLADAVAFSVNTKAQVTVRPCELASFVPGRGAELLLNGEPWGWLGELDRRATDPLDLREASTMFELNFNRLEAIAELVPQAHPLPAFPTMTRDLNLVLDEQVLWNDLANTIRNAAGPLLENIQFGGQYRGKQIGESRKSYLCTLVFRATDRTLTSEEVDRAQQAVLTACTNHHAAQLRA